ncbi:MAG: glycoside hydrolase family protein [Leptolyngbyaceae cyanobacterium bins.349]|nr:glycoside hydrolase family protein [Leptolyngbyaceae cyanobacterium bins.349]
MKREQYANQQNHTSFQPQAVTGQAALEQGQFGQPANRNRSTNQLESKNTGWLNAANNVAAGVVDTVKSWVGAQGKPDMQAIPQALQKQGVNLQNSTISFTAKPNSIQMDVDLPQQSGGGRSLDVKLNIEGIGTRDLSNLRGSTIEFTAKPHSVEVDVATPKRSGGQRVDLDLNIEGVGTHNLNKLSGVIGGINKVIADLPQSDRQPAVATPRRNEPGNLLQRINSRLTTQTQPTRSQPSFDKATGHINQEGLNIVKQAEGFRSNAYRDAGGKWTIGYGHTATADPGDRVSQAQAEILLKKDIRSAENAVRRQIHVPLNSNQFSALTSLAYNIGEGGLKKSEVAKHLNAGNYQAAADSFGKIVHVGGPNGKVLPGLVTRRANERALFLKPDTPADSGKNTPNPAQRPSGAAQSYTVQKGDTLSEIAQKHLGDGDRWRELRAADGSTFTEESAKKLQVGAQIHFPGSQPADRQLTQPPSRTVPPASSPTNKLLEVARSYVGVREQGNNRGREVEMFQRTIGGSDGEPWCMSFAQFCIQKAGAATKVDPKVFRSEHCLTVWNNSPKSQRSSR